MPTSSYFYESGEPIEVGSHGDSDYLYHSGDPVPNSGDSTYVFESGTGLGTTTGFMAYRYGTGQDHNDLVTLAENTLNTEGVFVQESEQTFADAVDQYSPNLVLINGMDGANAPSSADLTAAKDLHDSGGGFIMITDDANNSAPFVVRDFNNELVGNVGFQNSTEGVGLSTPGCTSNLPSHSNFDGVSSVYRRSSEQPIVDNESPFVELSTDPDNVWAEYDGTGGRIWLDGGNQRWSDAALSNCDTQTYAENVLEWGYP